MPERPSSKWALFTRTGALLLSGALLSACSTPAINLARTEFYKGNYAQAETEIDRAETDELNEVLWRMERGTIRQAAGNYQGSSEDYIRSSDLLKDLETYSVSKGAASMVVNDNVQSFIGVPFERAMLHDLTALNHFAVGNWEHAAVEARRIIQVQHADVRGEYPDDAFSRYVAGTALLMVDDYSNAELQYRTASDLLDGLTINAIGVIAPVPITNQAPDEASTTNAPPPKPAFPRTRTATNQYPAMLTCFALLGKSPSGQELLNGMGHSPLDRYVEIYHRNEYLGRTYTLTDVYALAYRTAELEALRKAAKTAARVAMKEGVAQSLEHNDQALLGALVRLVLIGLLEEPDTRRWETLPHWLQAATIACPPDLDEYDAVIKTASGITLQTIHVTFPITRKGNRLISLFRDLPSPPADGTAVAEVTDNAVAP
ncbi:MAG: hypothetical protein PHP44_14080 [Kiritimatiellae bacterium]|nr:hypothetical protein [Kiritimatiellia bacterium]MDD4737220.1 hypothetical protein [Kiritimatiellia bacterium]